MSLVDLDERFTGAWTVRPTQHGRDELEKFQARISDPRTRRREIRNEYLLWIDEKTQQGRYAVADDFLVESEGLGGIPWTQEDLILAGAWLKERGFIDGPSAWQRADPLRSKSTARGEHWVEEGLDVHEDPHRAGSASYTFNGPAQVAHGGTNFTQNQTISIGAQAHELAELLHEFAQGLDEERALQVRSAAEEIAAEAGGAVDRSKLHVAAEKALTIIAAGAAGGFGKLVVDKINDLIVTL